VSQLLSKVTVTSCSFYTSNVQFVCLDDTLLKCVVTEVILCAVVAFKTLAFHKVM